MKLLVYAPILTPRIKYIFSFIFNDVLKTQIGFSSDMDEFKQSNLPKISYASHPLSTELFFKNADLLLSHTISLPSFKTTAFGDSIVPFAVEGGALPFDVFAASFYFVSRYEEYLPFEPDLNGGYPAEMSLQNKLKLLLIPVVDGWALLLKNILLKRYPDLFFEKKNFKLTPLVCMYPTKDPEFSRFISTALGIFKKIAGFRNRNFNQESKLEEFHTFLKTLHEQFKLNGHFFYKPSRDTLHEREEQISLPQSYLRFIKAGIKNDYSMGYATNMGFRAGTCSPFYWYDLQLEKVTHLLVHPVAFNDLCLNLDKQFKLQALLQWKNLADTVKLLEGDLYILWHQDSLYDTGKGKAGRKLYAEILSNFYHD